MEAKERRASETNKLIEGESKLAQPANSLARSALSLSLSPLSDSFLAKLKWATLAAHQSVSDYNIISL